MDYRYKWVAKSVMGQPSDHRAYHERHGWEPVPPDEYPPENILHGNEALAWDTNTTLADSGTFDLYRLPPEKVLERERFFDHKTKKQDYFYLNHWLCIPEDTVLGEHISEFMHRMWTEKHGYPPPLGSELDTKLRLFKARTVKREPIHKPPPDEGTST